MKKKLDRKQIDLGFEKIFAYDKEREHVYYIFFSLGKETKKISLHMWLLNTI